MPNTATHPSARTQLSGGEAGTKEVEVDAPDSVCCFPPSSPNLLIAVVAVVDFVVFVVVVVLSTRRR